MKLENIRSLSDRAIALHYTLELLGGRPTIDDLMRVAGKSQATVYRALAELQDAGLAPVLSPREPKHPSPSPAKHRRYCVTPANREAS